MRSYSTTRTLAACVVVLFAAAAVALIAFAMGAMVGSMLVNGMRVPLTGAEVAAVIETHLATTSGAAALITAVVATVGMVVLTGAVAIVKVTANIAAAVARKLSQPVSAHRHITEQAVGCAAIVAAETRGGWAVAA